MSASLPKGGRVVVGVLVWAVALGAAGERAAHAQAFGGTGSGADDAPSQAALPAIDHVATAATGGPGLSLATAIGYGYQSGVFGGDDTHQRAAGTLAVGYGIAPWLAVALELDGRYDNHSIGDQSDDGFVSDPRVTVRAAGAPRGDLVVGAQLGLWLPSDSPGISLSAATPELRVLASYQAAAKLTVHGNLGLRIDRSAASVPNPDSLSLPDRLSLGVSDSNAVLFGVAVARRVGKGTLFGEWSWDLLVGGESPGALESPMRLSAGVRWPLSAALDLRVLADLRMSALPAVTFGAPLSPVEPRYGVTLALAYRAARPRAAGTDGQGELVASSRPVAPTENQGTLHGRVVSPDGKPVAGARVKVTVGGKTVETTSGADGSWTVSGVPAGSAEVEIKAEGYNENAQAATVPAGGDAPVEVKLERPLPSGQLRGTVQSFTGKSLRATLVVQPVDAAGTPKTINAQPDGTFELDLPPGNYAVVIRAEGHIEQTRKVTIEQNGVTILNADLRPGRRGR